MITITTKNNWKQPRYRTECYQVYALLPIYLSDETNGSQMYYMDGCIELIDKQLNWVLDDWLLPLRSSKSLLWQQSYGMLKQLGQPKRRRLPLLLAPDFALMPVKARQPQNRYHAADGYVVYAMIEKIKKNKDGAGSIILFKNGQQLFVLDSVRTLRENMQMIKQLVEAMKDSMTPSPDLFHNVFPNDSLGNKDR